MVCSHYKAVSPNATYTQTQGVSNNLNVAQAIVFDPNYKTSEATTFGAAMDGVQLVYELATPLVIQLTPTEIQMLLGDNTIWNDVGDMTLEYLADGPADDIDALQILLGNRYVNNGGVDEASDREALDILLGGNTR